MKYEQLIKDLKEGFGLTRAAAATELGKLKDKRAAKALGILKADAAVLPLMQALNDTSYIVRKSAARSLGQIEDPRALEALERAVSDSDRVVADMAQQALAKLRNRY